MSQLFHRMCVGEIMKTSNSLRRITSGLCAAAAALTLSTTPAAANYAHGGVGFHGGYGWHGGGYWHGGWGWGWRGGWGPWGWGWGGLGLGLYAATLPAYYNTYYWGGVPYYYANYTYYRWDPAAAQYVTVAPPSGVAQLAPSQAPAGAPAAPPVQSNLIVYPKNGQNEEATGRDKFECHKWAVSQTGFDPTQPGGGAAPAKRGDYFRAQSACLEGRGYSVK
jgi:hypothetical protein